MKKSRYEWTKDTYIINSKDKRYKRFQKIKKETGISPDETWSLFNNICDFIIPRLKLYLKESKKVGCYPCRCKNRKEWENILKEMIWTFTHANKDDDFSKTREEREKENNRINKGLKLFAEHFFELWW